MKLSQCEMGKVVVLSDVFDKSYATGKPKVGHIVGLGLMYGPEIPVEPHGNHVVPLVLWAGENQPTKVNQNNIELLKGDQ